MPTNIAFNYPYYGEILRRLKKMEQKNQQTNWQPEQYRGLLQGGARIQVLPGGKSEYPMLNSVDLDRLNKIKYKRPPVQGSGRKIKNHYEVERRPFNEKHQKLIEKIHHAYMTGGDWKHVIKRIGKKYGPAVLSGILDASPAVAGAAGTFLGSPLVGTVASVGAQAVRKGIKHYSGYGMKKNLIKKKGKMAVSLALDKVIPMAASYLIDEPHSRYHPGSKGTVVGNYIRKGIKAATGLGRLTKHEKELKDLIVYHAKRQQAKHGGAIDFSKVLKHVSDFVRHKLQDGVKYGNYKLAKHVAHALGMHQLDIPAVAHFLNQLVSGATGFEVYGEGHKKKPKMIKMEGKKGKIQGPGSGKRAQRNELVRKIMVEKGLNLPSASRYIKENNLM